MEARGGLSLGDGHAEPLHHHRPAQHQPARRRRRSRTERARAEAGRPAVLVPSHPGRTRTACAAGSDRCAAITTPGVGRSTPRSAGVHLGRFTVPSDTRTSSDRSPGTPGCGSRPRPPRPTRHAADARSGRGRCPVAVVARTCTRRGPHPAGTRGGELWLPQPGGALRCTCRPSDPGAAVALSEAHPRPAAGPGSDGRHADCSV